MAIFDPQIVTTTGQGVTTPMPPWMENRWESYANRADILSQQDYQAYPQARIAPFGADQLASFDLARGGVGVGAGIAQQGVGALDTAMQGPTTAGIEQYMNPYSELVTQDVLRELGRQNQMGGIADRAQAAQVGAFGGSRMGIVESERARNFDRLSADIYNQSRSQNYGQAQQQFNMQQQYGMQGAQMYGGLGSVMQNLGQQDVASMLGIGGLQQAQGQQSLDLAYGDFLRQQQWPYENVSYAADILQGVPSAQQTTQTTQQAPAASIGQQIAGLGLAGLGVYGAFFQ
jgi:hypothetical protein